MRKIQPRRDLKTIYLLLRDAFVIQPKGKMINKHNSILLDISSIRLGDKFPARTLEDRMNGRRK